MRRWLRLLLPLLPLPPLLPVKTDGEAMGLIPQPTQQGNTELVRLTVQGLPLPRQEHLLSLLGEGADVEILVQIEFPQGLHHGRELAFAAIDHHHIGPVVETVGLQGTAAPMP